MDTYSFLRGMADSWGLVGLVIVFLGAVLWAFRPGSRASQRDCADIPLRNESAPPDSGLGSAQARTAEDR